MENMFNPMKMMQRSPDNQDATNTGKPKDPVEIELEILEKDGFKKNVTFVYRDNPFYKENLPKFIAEWEKYGAKVNVITVPQTDVDEEIVSYIESHMPAESDLVMTDRTCLHKMEKARKTLNGQVVRNDLDEKGKFSLRPHEFWEREMDNLENEEKIKKWANIYKEYYKSHLEKNPPRNVYIGLGRLLDHDPFYFHNDLFEKSPFTKEDGTIFGEYDVSKFKDMHQSEESKKVLEHAANFHKKILMEAGIPEEKIKIVNSIFDELEPEKNTLSTSKAIEFIKDKFSNEDWVVADGHQMRMDSFYIPGGKSASKEEIDQIRSSYPHLVCTDLMEGRWGSKLLDVPKTSEEMDKDIAGIVLDYKNKVKE